MNLRGNFIMKRKRRSKSIEEKTTSAIGNNLEQNEKEIEPILDDSASKQKRSKSSSKTKDDTIGKTPMKSSGNKESKQINQGMKDTSPLSDQNNNATISEVRADLAEKEKMLSNGKQTQKRLRPVGFKSPVKKGNRADKKGSSSEIETEDERDFVGDYEDEIIDETQLNSVEKIPSRVSSAKKRKTKSDDNKDKKDDVQNSEAFKRIMEELAEVKRQLNEHQEAKSRQSDEASKSEDQNIVKSKSHSSTTIYNPAVKRAIQPDVNDISNHLSRQTISPEVVMHKKQDINQSIDDFLTEIRDETSSSDEETTNKRRPVHRRLDYNDVPQADPMETAREQARDRILNAEKHRAQVEMPKGIDSQIQVLDDDTLMHMTYCVEDNMTEKIEKGKFIEMDSLGSKLDELGESSSVDENRMVLVNRGGWSAWEPASNSRKHKITNVYQWEKSFRLYMGIYTRANPGKASEMIQYLHTIHHAATKFTWENVANYDRVFRRWMEKNPNRSWGKTLSQMWNYHLTDPLPKHSNSQQTGKKEARTCWKFNKGECNYPFCKFPHRCTYCGGASHGAHVCFKKNRKSETRPNRQNSQGGQKNGGNNNHQSSGNNSSSSEKTQEGTKNQ